MGDGPADFGIVLRRFRVAAGLSQEALAERARLSAKAVSALERGARRAPYGATVRALASALDLSTAEQGELEAARVPRSSRLIAAGPAGDGGVELRKTKTNVPLQLKCLIGREADVAEITSIVQRNRLVTVTGAGGIGKTRTVLQIATDLGASWSDGVWLVELASLSDPALVVTAIGAVLGLRASPSRSILDGLLTYLSGKSLLLILDNCEHVIAEAAAATAAILHACPGIRILATSRESLRVAGERTYRLPSLRVPPPSVTAALSVGEATGYGAIALFAARAQAIDHRFSLGEENVATVAEICGRLDGIPLAIELAAARVKVLSLKTLAAKLDKIFQVLVGGERTAIPRHQTMRALIDWSYVSLSRPEQHLFDGLSVFAGGCTLATATAVFPCDDSDELDMLDLLSSLVDKSLLVADLDADEPRYRLLEAYREYGREKLAMRCQYTVVARRHALAYLELAEQLMRAYDATPERRWDSQASPELDNWRAALQWTLAARGDVVTGQRLVGVLLRVWTTFAYAEGRRWVRTALELVDEQTPPTVAAQLYLVEAAIADDFSEHAAALAAGKRALVRYRDLGEVAGTVRALKAVGRSLVLLGRVAEGEPLLQEALTAARTLGDRMQLGGILECIALARSMDRDIAGARAHFADAVSNYTALGRENAAATVALNQAEAEFIADHAAAALELAADALMTFRTHGDLYSVTNCLGNMAAYLVALARYDEARAYAYEALELARELHLEVHVAWTVQHLAAIAARRPQSSIETASDSRRRAARLLGFVAARLASLNVVDWYTEQQEYDRTLTGLRDAIDVAELATLMAAGAAMSEEQAIEEAFAMS
jgi:predicted ATPase/transcriptional regulator with XRE-family HTH domain